MENKGSEGGNLCENVNFERSKVEKMDELRGEFVCEAGGKIGGEGVGLNFIRMLG